jgi:adenylyltransferase/sulfurtransferase
VAASGLALAVVPGRGPCLRCLFRDPPPAGTLATCDTAGVLLPAVGAVASMQAGLALRLLAAPEGLVPALVELDAWEGRARRVEAARDPDCPACARRSFPFLEQPPPRAALVLCGRNAVQVLGAGRGVDLERLARRVDGLAHEVRRAGAFLRFSVDGHRLTLFPDGRALVEGTEDADRALALYDRYVGG